MANERLNAHRIPWRLAGLGSGMVFALVALIAFLISRGPDDTSGQAIAVYFAEHDDAVEWQAFLFGISAVFLIWFAGAVNVAARRSEPATAARFGEIAFAGAVAAVVVYFVAISCWTTLAHLFGGFGGGRFTEAALGDSLTLFNLADVAVAMASFTSALFVGAAAKALSASRLVVDWFAWAGAAVALLLVINAFVQLVGDPDSVDHLGTVSFLLFLAWVFASSAALAAGALRHDPAERAAPAGD